MTEARNDHGLIYFQGYVYAFGGGPGRDPLNSAEYYDIENDSWQKILPDMPEVGKLTTCTSMENQILLTSRSFPLVSFEPATSIYTVLSLELPQVRKLITQYSNRIYLFTDEESHEITDEGQILRTVKGGVPRSCDQTFFTTKGILFAMSWS